MQVMDLNRIFKRKPAGAPSGGGRFDFDRKHEADVVLAAPQPEAHSYELNYGDPTPYGRAVPSRAEVEAEGIEHFRIEHNEDGRYVRLSEERNAAIPEEYRNENRFYADHGNYGRPKATELDVVIVTHPDAFDEEDLEWASDRIAVRDAPADVQADLDEVLVRTSIAQGRADRLREQLKVHEGAERKWAASVVAAGTLEQFPRATEVSYLLHGDNLVGSISVSDGEKTLGSLTMNQDGTITGSGHEAGRAHLHASVRKLDDVPDTWMAEQGAEVSPADSNGERTVTIQLASVLSNAAERVRDEDFRRR